MKGFCTRSIPTITTLRLMDFLKSFSTSLNSSESLDNDTRWYCLLDSMEDQWFGVLVTLAFLLCSTLTAFWDLMKKMVIQCGQCKTQTADYFFHHANVNVTTMSHCFLSLKAKVRSQSAVCTFTLPQCSGTLIVLQFNFSPKNVKAHWGNFHETRFRYQWPASNRLDITSWAIMWHL